MAALASRSHRKATVILYIPTCTSQTAAPGAPSQVFNAESFAQHTVGVREWGGVGQRGHCRCPRAPETKHHRQTGDLGNRNVCLTGSEVTVSAGLLPPRPLFGAQMAVFSPCPDTAIPLCALCPHLLFL